MRLKQRRVRDVEYGDWQEYSPLRDFPLYLWSASCTGSIAGAERRKGGLQPVYGRVKFPFVDTEIDIDARLIARLYRGWWARVWFPLQTGTTLAHLLKEPPAMNWPNANTLHLTTF